LVILKIAEVLEGAKTLTNEKQPYLTTIDRQCAHFFICNLLFTSLVGFSVMLSIVR